MRQYSILNLLIILSTIICIILFFILINSRKNNTHCEKCNVEKFDTLKINKAVYYITKEKDKYVDIYERNLGSRDFLIVNARHIRAKIDSLNNLLEDTVLINGK